MAEIPLNIPYFGEGLSVTMDPYAPNVLEDYLRTAWPDLYRAATEDGPCPRMFNGGEDDLPTITASGENPRLLLELPGLCRHHAASLPDRYSLFELLETVRPDDYKDCAGLRRAVDRVQQWARGADPDPFREYGNYDQAAAEEVLTRLGIGPDRTPGITPWPKNPDPATGR
ncbi:hypothetical protein ACW2Q0_18935 [Nocardia sp. R16R-3T]